MDFRNNISDGGSLTSPDPDKVQIRTISSSLVSPTSDYDDHKPTKKLSSECRVYSFRYVVLFLFCLYSMSNAFQWIEYSIINNIICTYYDVDTISVNWTSVVYMVVYIPLIFPASWLLEKRGLRCVVILGSLGTCIGSWVKCLSISPDRFVVTMVGQSIVAISQIFILGIPPKLAAVWFSDKEVSTACAVGVFGNQVGIALGFLLPPQVVPNTEDKDVIGTHLSYLFYGVAGFTTVLFLIIILAFKEKPPLPPSRAQAAIVDNENQEKYWKSMLNLVKNPNYIILLITYGINVGVFYAISTLLNQIVLSHYPDTQMEVGWMGLTIVISGMAGSVLCGLLLDKTHRFKETTLGVYVLSLVGMIGFTISLDLASFWVVFAIAGLLGFFMTGYLPLGFEFAAEITYPESEGTSSGLLNASAQVFGILFTMVGTVVFESHGDLITNLCLVGTLVIGTILTVFIKSDLRRQNATNYRPRDQSADQLMSGVISPVDIA